MVCATFKRGFKIFSTLLLLYAQTPNPRPKAKDIGAATNTNDKVCIEGFHWPKADINIIVTAANIAKFFPLSL